MNWAGCFRKRDAGREKTIRELEAALNLKADYFEAHQALGAVYLQIGNLAKAEKRLREALHLKPNSGDS